tara:strand:- start:2190 stop:2411 length:222 start_codon:yes stop_codon:yes gene_type:complete
MVAASKKTVSKKTVEKIKPCCVVRKTRATDTVFLAAIIVESAQATVTRLGRDIDIVEFPKTYAKLKKLYEETT